MDIPCSICCGNPGNDISCRRLATRFPPADGNLGLTSKVVLKFVADVLPRADDAIDNALAVSFIEDFSLGDCTDARKAAIRDRSPESIRQ